MAIGVTAILNAIESHALAIGVFEQVNMHEPKNAPMGGLTCAVWAQSITSAASSGLAATTAHVIWNLRIFSPMVVEPQDAIDPAVLDAVDVLFAALLADYTLGETVRMIDVRGMAGVRMSAQAGYLRQDNTEFRVMTITLPVLVNDAWDEVP